MEGFLILAGLILGVVCVLWARSQDQDRSVDGPVGSVGDAGSLDSASDPAELFIDHHSISGPFDDLGNGVRDAVWTNDPFTLGIPGQPAAMSSSDDLCDHRVCINPATGLPMISDSEVGFDVGGNPYGFSNDELFTDNDSSASGFDSSSSSDSFGSFGNDDWS